MAEDITTTDDAITEPPAGYIAEDEVNKHYVSKTFMDAEIKRRLKNKTSAETLLGDEEFKQKALDAWGVKPEAKKKPDGEELSKLYGDWEQKHLKPLQDAMTKQQQTVERLRTRDRDGQIVAAAAKVVEDRLLQSPVPGSAPQVVNMIAPYLTYDEDTDGWYVKQGDGYAPASKPVPGQPFKTVEEFVTEWAKSMGFTKDQRQRGAGLGNPSLEPNQGTIKSRADLKSVAEKVAWIKEHGREKFEQLPAK